MRKLFIFTLVMTALSCSQNVDVLIIGGGISGTSAGLQVARSGAVAMIVEEGPWLGGKLTSGGVSCTDGNYNMRGGIFGEFTDAVAEYYGGYDALRTGWVSNINFEPHVGAEIFASMTAAEPNLTVKLNAGYKNLVKTSKGWTVTVMADGKSTKVSAKILIDATELGDVAAALGVPYSVGMDCRDETGESIAPAKANDIVQDLTLVAVLKDFGADADMTIPMPEGYDPELYRNSAIAPTNKEFVVDEAGRYKKADTGQSIWAPGMMITYGKLATNGGPAKYMINWPCDGNDFYTNLIDKTPEERKAALDSAANVTLGFVYFIQTELGMKNLGLADDEFATPNGLAYIPYNRESRRIDGEVRFRMDDAARPFEVSDPLYRTGIAVGDYPVDHHHFRHPRWFELPYLEFYPIPSFTLPLGVMLPKGFDDLIVAEMSISVTNLINGTTRLQPVITELGQAAGALAALASKNPSHDLRSVPVRSVQEVILADGGYIMPYFDVPVSDPDFAAIQRVGATGIMRGLGQNIGWSNRTIFRPEDPAVESEIFLDDYYPGKTPEDLDICLVNPTDGSIFTRREVALQIDSKLHPFESFAVDYTGAVVAVQ